MIEGCSAKKRLTGRRRFGATGCNGPITYLRPPEAANIPLKLPAGCSCRFSWLSPALPVNHTSNFPSSLSLLVSIFPISARLCWSFKFVPKSELFATLRSVEIFKILHQRTLPSGAHYHECGGVIGNPF
ncbi:hypothetical protein J6590_018695 [Homalodisca vitripennis]|nr:hypothetical protein J6590_018695 [Homalodisca vitripennis]